MYRVGIRRITNIFSRVSWNNEALFISPIESTSTRLLYPLEICLQNHLNTRSFAADAARDVSPPNTTEDLQISNAAVERLKELTQQHKSGATLRLTIEGGGCSGFQYEFNLDETATIKDGDRVFTKDGVSVVCDDLSLEFLKGATIDYESDLMRSAFVVQDNPNAETSCGCGSSFQAK
jgi:iron-sulfur cluster assembly 2